MSEGALLIDWDNVVINARKASYYPEPVSLGVALARAAAEWCASTGTELRYREIFVPYGYLGRDVINALSSAGLSVLETGRTPQMADVEMVARAFELRYKHGVTAFVLASGDHGFVSAARRLVRGGRARCAVWPFSEASASDEIIRAPAADREWLTWRYVRDLVPSARREPVPTSAAWTLALLCHKLADRDRKLWSVGGAIAELSADDMLGDGAEEAWRHAAALDLFAFDAVDGLRIGHRRLNYENPELARFLELCDELLWGCAGPFGEPFPDIDHPSVVAGLHHPSARPADAPMILEAILAAGYLVPSPDAAGSLRLSGRDARLGTLHRLRRQAAIGLTLRRQHPRGIPVDRIANRWPFHLMLIDKNTPRSILRELRRDGDRAARAAHSCGLFAQLPAKARRDGGTERFLLRTDHPIVKQTEMAVDAILRSIAQTIDPTSRRTTVADATQAMRNLGPIAGLTPNAHREWLGLLAAEQHISIRGGMIGLGENRGGCEQE